MTAPKPVTAGTPHGALVQYTAEVYKKQPQYGVFHGSPVEGFGEVLFWFGYPPAPVRRLLPLDQLFEAASEAPR